jgi:hypothetical protein
MTDEGSRYFGGISKQELAERDALESRVSDLRAGLAALQEQIDGTRDYNGMASLCVTCWGQLRSVDLVMHELLIHDHDNAGALAPPPSEVIRECLAGAYAQVKAVMAEEYDLEIGKKRLHLASALALQGIETIDQRIDAMRDAEHDQWGQVRRDGELDRYRGS